MTGTVEGVVYTNAGMALNDGVRANTSTRANTDMLPDDAEGANINIVGKDSSGMNNS
jgi:hypothetical protein